MSSLAGFRSLLQMTCIERQPSPGLRGRVDSFLHHPADGRGEMIASRPVFVPADLEDPFICSDLEATDLLPDTVIERV